MEAKAFGIKAALNSVSEEDSEWAAFEGWDGGGVNDFCNSQNSYNSQNSSCESLIT